ncbi:MAG: tetratricopeptide repeat protein [Gemmatimonadota bacterium]|jgi:TolB-like protein/Tfp pilus assembly protein PilF
MTLRFKELLRETHRRSLWQVLGVYVVASWVVLQVIDTLTSVLRLPDWLPSLALVLLLVGLPIVLATAFVQSGFKGADEPLPRDGGDGGEGDSVERHDPGPIPSSPSADGIRRFLTWRNALGGGVLAFALWGVVATGWMILGAPSRVAANTDGPPGVAVLPFVNRSAGDSDAFFTDGLHDELLTQLSKIAGIKVISRTSVMGYRDTDLAIPEIASQLGVQFILEGGLLRAGDQVRLNVQLIDGTTDAHVWANSYDRAMTVENLLAIQSEIVRSVVREVQAVISPEEAELVADLPTRDSEAYELYLRGEDWLNRGGLSAAEYEYAARFYEEAIALDPTFALAYAKSASAHVRMYFQGHDVTPARLDRARLAIDRALELDPDHPEVRECYGDYLYYGLRDYDAALAEYRAALARLPNSSTLISREAWILRRQGHWEESLAGLERVREMDPRSGDVLLNLGVSLTAMRRYEEAEEAYRLGATFNPELEILWGLRGWNELLRGDTTAAIEAMREVPEAVLRGPFVTSNRLELLRLRRDYRGLLDGVIATEGDVTSTSGGVTLLPLLRGYAYQGLGQAERARAAFEEARALAERILIESPDDWRVPGPLGLALAELGLREEAPAAGRRGVEMLDVSGDALWGGNTVWDLAQIHARLGEPDAAIELLGPLLSAPGSDGHIGQLELDPLFDSIRSHPGFQALIERYRDSPGG